MAKQKQTPVQMEIPPDAAPSMQAAINALRIEQITPDKYSAKAVPDRKPEADNGD